ncbi:MAG: hypothetical protein D6739_00870 [Nitrospirae bacterium]|nr:MAG: hypothetical protein D6739_00870 [Nitrospirota bacterium]
MPEPPTISEVVRLRDAFEADGRQATGVHLPAEVARRIRWELHQLYGFDPGPELMTLYGMEVLSTDAEAIRFEG